MHRNPVTAQPDREPMDTYERAVWRLVQFTLDRNITPEVLEILVEIVADIYWLGDKKVRRDLQRALCDIGGV